MTIWSHTLVQNEERYIWYALMSVIDYVDRALIWDTGSEDKTVAIIKELEGRYPKKVSYKQVGKVDPDEFTKARQEMLKETGSDWFILVDGDEVWWDDSIKEIVSVIQKEGKKLETIVNRSYLPVGDIFHYQEEAAGMYEIDGVRGHLTIRAINRKIPGLHLEKPHGKQGFFDEEGTLIQDRSKKYRKFMDVYYLHLTHLPRSSTREMDTNVPKRAFKLKYELGIPYPSDFYYPEVFFRPKPDVVCTPWENMSQGFLLRAFAETPFRKVKRRLYSGKGGY